MSDYLSRTVLDFVRGEGAIAAGIATRETLSGGPPSVNLAYIHPDARSAVSFAVPLRQDLIEPYLAKENRRMHEIDNLKVNSICSGIALNLAKYLEQKGHPSVPVAANNVYRTETPGGSLDMFPDLSLRCLAVACGVGHFGLSGSVILPEVGAAVILGGVVTTAELVATDPLPAKAAYCDKCRICQAVCPSGMMDPKEEARITLGGREFTYSRRRNYLRCQYVCGGFTGLHPSGQWSTWSPGRFAIPEKDDEFRAAMAKGLKAYARRPGLEGGFYHPFMRDKLYITCGNCQLVCHPEKNERKKRFDLLKAGGVIIQAEDGSLTAISHEKAEAHLKAMAKERRALYEDR
jgi:epoxyqueuosine reductase QueG